MIKKKNNIRNLQKIFRKIKFKEEICIIHSDLFSFRQFNVSLKDFFETLISTLGKKKTFIFPTFSWVKKKNWYSKFEPSNVGALSEYVRKNRKTKRSLNPIHSVCIFGKNKKIPTHYSKSSFCEGSTWDWLCKSKNVMNLALGIGLEGGATFLHLSEEKNNVDYRYYKKLDINIYNNKKKRVAKRFYYYSRRRNFFNSWKKCENDLIKKNLLKKIKNKFNIPIYLANTFYVTKFIDNKIKKNPSYLLQN